MGQSQEMGGKSTENRAEARIYDRSNVMELCVFSYTKMGKCRGGEMISVPFSIIHTGEIQKSRCPEIWSLDNTRSGVFWLPLVEIMQEVGCGWGGVRQYSIL